LRHEAWGSRAFARASVRTVSVARADVAGPLGTSLRVTHSVYRVRRGDNLYLPEPGGDRLVLKAVSGAGERTRVELRVPAGRGAVLAALSLSAAPQRAPRPEWTLDWTRRTRARVRPRRRRRRGRPARPTPGR